MHVLQACSVNNGGYWPAIPRVPYHLIKLLTFESTDYPNPNAKLNLNPDPNYNPDPNPNPNPIPYPNPNPNFNPLNQ